MDEETGFDEVLTWLRKEAEDYIRSKFDRMPPVIIKCGEHLQDSDIDALYTRYTRVIEFAPHFLAACTDAGKPIWKWALKNVLLHELIHAWVDWIGEWTDESDGHNEVFLRKAFQLGLTLTGTLNKYPRAESIYLMLEAEARAAHWNEINRKMNLGTGSIFSHLKEGDVDAFSNYPLFVGAC
ncbi:MAG TPA: hypothetical protein VER76_10275 [Pyrinomonadaceae bacterium]|nr:hypothetical protein [Pyrinomonadaceae bacterium]